jgi:hypothetical protein
VRIGHPDDPLVAASFVLDAEFLAQKTRLNWKVVVGASTLGTNGTDIRGNSRKPDDLIAIMPPRKSGDLLTRRPTPA